MAFTSDQPTTTRYVEWVFSLVVVGLVAVSWIMLFKLNSVLFSTIGVTQFISWIFLPAAIRMLSVMLLEWIGAAGLFLGALVTSEISLDHNLSEALMLSGMSALGPVLTVAICTRWLRLPPNLAGLGPRQLTLFALIGALCNVVPHNIYFYFAEHSHSLFEGMVPMFIGDLTGTIIVLYLAALILRFGFPAKKLD